MWYFQAHGVRGLDQSVRRFAGMKPVRETLLGMVDAVSDAKRRASLERMNLRRAARLTFPSLVHPSLFRQCKSYGRVKGGIVHKTALVRRLL
jgi:hypothetical protein